ncbi:Glycosyltransferase [Ignavibacterium album JCM 16511]|uniref:Glycosyltransferase n=1 Tax=Ignavibacterium album (strain DSM 19864 / JCM 16511 / NBRC 101810 / Mat9-16) TaxID=945713 RepID=I0AMH4_IGNAJ|nr:glycosyltransferase family 2 protein [Ignavibacterium album]AFH50181.1 Glycosyltransferase [Ignavibacterium album JCM 16511]
MRFSIIIPTYNRSELLIETINSVLNQTFKDYEVIVVNDGSTDSTKEILDGYGDKIKAIHKENSGAEKSRNAGAEIAKGEYFCFFDSDDLIFPWTLDIYNKVIETEQLPPLVLGQPFHFSDFIPVAVIIGVKETVRYAVYKDYFSKDRTVYSSSSMIVIKRDYFYKVGMFRQHYAKKEYFLDDLDFMLRAGTINPTIIIFEPFQFAYRTHSENSVKNLRRVIKSLSYLILEEKQGIFAGGDVRKFERQAIIGGPCYYWLFKALANGIFGDSIKFFFKAYPYIFKGLIKKIRNKFRTKIPLKTI